MARVLIRTQPWGVVQDRNGNALVGQSVHIANTDGTVATTWSAQTGGTSTTTDQVTDSDGSIPRYIEAGEYDVTVGGATIRVEASSGLITPVGVTGSRKIRDGMGSSAAHAATAMATPPTITMGGTPGGLTQSLASNYAAFSDNVIMAYNSGTTGNRPQGVLLDTGSRSGGWGQGWLRAFAFDGQKFAMFFTQSATFKFRVWAAEVNGTMQPHSTALVNMSGLTGYTGSGALAIIVDFGSRARRQIIFEIEDVSSAPTAFSTKLGPTESITPINIPSLRTCWVGDSFGQGTGATVYSSAFAQQAFRALGHWSTSPQQSMASTGLVKTNTPNGAYFSRIADVIAGAYDVVVIQASINDSPYVGLNQIGPALQTYISTLRASSPATRIIVTGPIYMATPITAYNTIRDEMQTQAVASGVTFIDTLPTGALWYFGTGRSGATTGDGNADIYRATDGTHPNDAGHYDLSRVFAGPLGQVLQQTL